MGMIFGDDRKAAKMWRERQRENMKRLEEQNASLNEAANRSEPTANFLGRTVDDKPRQ